VPLFAPGVEKTFIPTTSCVETSVRQPSATLAVRVRFVIPSLTISRIRSGRGRNASIARASSTMTTRARGAVWPPVNEAAITRDMLAPVIPSIATAVAIKILRFEILKLIKIEN
jgi:hypothetical protein